MFSVNQTETIVKKSLPWPSIVPLSAGRDDARVGDLLGRAADYLRLETGRAPDAATIKAFFGDAPEGCDPAASLKLGQAMEGRLISLADLAFGFPGARDAYVGLLLLDPAWRRRGFGARMLADLARRARARGCARLYAAVLDANTAGRRFWEREGFRAVLTTEPRRYGDRVHVAHRMERTL